MRMGLWVVVLLAACKGDVEYVSCEAAEDCADWVPDEATAVCLPKADDGFCSWECSADTDCEGDADEDFAYVCSSFESTAGMYCFPQCNDGEDSALEECPGGFTCRSTGGGADNRRICFPNEDT